MKHGVYSCVVLCAKSPETVIKLGSLFVGSLSPVQDELLAELEGMEQEELEKDLLQVPAGSSKLPEDTIGADDLPAVRKYLQWRG